MKAPGDGWDREEREALRELEPLLDVLRRRHDGDPPLDLLQAGRARVLPDDLQARTEQYLAEEPSARTLTEDLAAMPLTVTAADEDRLLRRILRDGPGQARRSTWSWPLRPAFALITLTLLVTSVSSLWYLNRAARPEPQPAAPAAAVIPPVRPAFVLPLEKAPVSLTVAALTWRGSPGERSLAEHLRPGLDAYRAGDYTVADRELGRAAAAYPGAVEPFYYQGVSRLFLNDVAGAHASLSTAARLAEAPIEWDVAWYLGVAEERAGRIAEARVRMASLCQSASARAPQACAALARMQ